MTVGAPEQIGRYRVEGVIGAGGFATVYRAVDERLDAVVAVKVLAENHCLDPDVRERFLTEGRALRRIGSPHVVAVHDLGESDRGQPYLVLDLADRGTLADRARNRRAAGWRPAPADVAHVAGALAESLAAVHSADLVHRDIAPRNLLVQSTRAPGTGPPCGLVDGDERLLLADLGLSKDLAVASGLTVGGGTAGFTPPEQRHVATRVDERADIWAATAVLVWLLTDRPPTDDGRWRADTAAAGWAPALVEVQVRGLATEPGDRFPTIDAWHAAIRAALGPPASTLVAAPAGPGPVPDRDEGHGPPVPPAAAPGGGPGGGEGPDRRDGPAAPLVSGRTGVPGPEVEPSGGTPGGGSGDGSGGGEGLGRGGGSAALVVSGRAGVPGPEVEPSGGAKPGGRGWRPLLALVAALLIGLLVGAGAGGLVALEGTRGDRPDRTVEQLDDGRVRVTVSAGDRRVALTGPKQIAVGETARFTAEVAGVEHWVWFGPDGGVHVDVGEIDVAAGSAGGATVRLKGVDGQNRVVEVVHRFDVVE